MEALNMPIDRRKRKEFSPLSYKKRKKGMNEKGFFSRFSIIFLIFGREEGGERRE